jgi:hypothetical protein
MATRMQFKDARAVGAKSGAATVGDGRAGSIQPNSRYCRIDRTSGHCQWPYAPAAAQGQGNADWR